MVQADPERLTKSIEILSVFEDAKVHGAGTCRIDERVNGSREGSQRDVDGERVPAVHGNSYLVMTGAMY